ncbi:hypothetical protein VSDG_02020 [Cytospora chrysosperma]|uniref:Uncharacterized protein n=1 Tax=Cytospora chrysosperma TaxID=252740 RepID=A0A423WDU0_CYTCH|nr:hypothetical protein VSDG_02020 [Valsa sordida]
MVKTARADTIIVTTIVAREVLLEACCLRFEAVAAISPSRLAKRGSWGWRLAVAPIFDGMSLYIKSY